jgi:hypothetical protein
VPKNSTKVTPFYGKIFFDEKRSAAGNRTFKGISLENKAKTMCWATDKIKM